MTNNFPRDSADIRPLQKHLISTIEEERERGCKPTKIQKTVDELKEAYRRTLAAGETQLSERFGQSIGAALPSLENAYADWKSIHRCFMETLRLAFNGIIPKENLLLDVLHADLKNEAGEPISALYTRMRMLWAAHLEKCPWDAFAGANSGASSEHSDQEDFDNVIDALNHGDDLDVEDAIEDLTGPLRYLFTASIEGDNPVPGPVLFSLWKRPEIIVINDYWRGKTQKRILDALRENAPQKFAGGFAKIQDFFTNFANGRTGRETTRPPDHLLDGLQKNGPREREKILRCLMLHPDNEVRRYAVSNVDLAGFWKVVTPQAVPCATILSQLEQVAGSRRFDENLRKVFFNAVYRRLLTLVSRSDVLYARGIARIFMQLDFLMADDYFEKLVTLLDYIEAKERHFGIKDSLLNEYAKKFMEEKKKVGPVESQPPDFHAIPPVVLRKLARDGHFWYELAMHPIYKVAKETIQHINTADRGYRIATNPNVNQDVLRAVGKNRSFFSSLRARLALLSNPRTPPAVSMDYVHELTKTDIESLLRKSSIHPELRRFLVKKYTQ